MAEIYLTDLCESEEAPSICKHHLDKAIETRPNSAEAQQLLASWCISMMDDDDEAEDKFEEAKKAIKTGVGLWLPQYQVWEVLEESYIECSMIYMDTPLRTHTMFRGVVGFPYEWLHDDTNVSLYCSSTKSNFPLTKTFNLQHINLHIAHSRLHFSSTESDGRKRR